MKKNTAYLYIKVIIKVIEISLWEILQKKKNLLKLVEQFSDHSLAIRAKMLFISQGLCSLVSNAKYQLPSFKHAQKAK